MRRVNRVWIVLVLLSAGGAGVCGTDNALGAADGAVVLLDPGTPINPADIIATTAPQLRSGGFREEVVSEVHSRFYGYAIAGEQHEGRWRWTGPIQGFAGNYGSSAAATWPNATDFLYEDSRSNASSVARLSPASDVPESANLRIYHYPARVGYDGGQYRIQDTLILAYIDPESGRRSTYAYRPQGQRHELFRYEAGRIPGQAYEASVVSLLTVATTDEKRFGALIFRVPVAVPRNTYSGGAFRVYHGRNYEGSDQPLGPPVRFSGTDHDAAMKPFDAALRARAATGRVSDDDFRHMYKFVRQVHRYLVEPKAAQ